MTDKNIVISLSNINKTYKTSNNTVYTAVDNISLEIERGERIGIVGHNGAGKTTLLKIISGCTRPTSGKVHTVGSIVSLIDLEAGFEPELTGKENIMVNGLLVGMSKQEVRQKMESIIQFADIGSYMNEPFYTN